jgi:fumarylacetoacetate (FAA) hydrolase
MKTGFGWVQAKPACAMAPVAVTPDEMGPAWHDARVDLPLLVDLNGARFGAAEGYHMAFGFDELIAHAARTRHLVAGTIIGSGTVSNANFREVGSSCIAERRGIELLDHGAPSTPYMAFGDRVRMECRDRSGASVFGAIDQRVVPAARGGAGR